jgi:hypothetical protein
VGVVKVRVTAPEAARRRNLPVASVAAVSNMILPCLAITTMPARVPVCWA